MIMLIDIYNKSEYFHRYYYFLLAFLDTD